MAVIHSSTIDEIAMSSPTKTQPQASAAASSSPQEQTDEPGFPAGGDRISDSEHRKFCHQCRQKTIDFVASCKEMKRGKACSIRFCRKCLFNRYGEKAEEVEALEGWKCPKCRGVCNCSVCMKRRGQRPTGILIHAARATGYSSVTELLHHGSPEGPNAGNAGALPIKRKLGKEAREEEGNEILGDEIVNQEDEAILLPECIPLMVVSGVEWPTDDVGPALQFLEFCAAFSEVLHINKGEPEAVLQEIARGHAGDGALPSVVIQFHLKLLSLLQMDNGEKSSPCSPDNARSWLDKLGGYIMESEFASKKLLLDCLDGDSFEYEKLGPSKKLRILNYLCDEALGVEDLRILIDEVNTKFLETKKEEREKIIASKKKGKYLKQKMKDEVKKVKLLSKGGAPSVSGQDDLASRIKSDTERAHAELVESMEGLPKKRQRRDAVRTEPILLNQHGQAFWRLEGYGCSDIMLQETGNQDLVTAQDKWFTYNKASEQVVEEYITTSRQWRQR